MITEAARTNVASSFQIARGDLGPLFVDRLRAQWNSLSPLVDLLSGYRPGSIAGSPDLQQVASHPDFPAVANILMQCDGRMLHRTGGGTAPVSFLGAYWNRAGNSEMVVTVTPSFQDSYLIRAFTTAADYLDWWVETLASKVTDSTPNYLPPPVALESMVYVLHAIDAFRRVAFRSMLDYAPAAEPTIKASEFQRTLNQAIGSKDLRWLLPAFLFLAPGLADVPFAPRPEHLDALAEQAFIIATKDATSGEAVFHFGEAGKTMGVEFYRSWMAAVGFETTALAPGGTRVVNRAFVAPTALANHLFRLEAEANGRVVVNHQAMTQRELRAKLEEMFKAGGEEPVKPIASQPAAIAFCPNCGARVKPGTHFCISCGTRLASASD